MGSNLKIKLKIIIKGFIYTINLKVVETLNEIEKKLKVDQTILRHLTVKYKKLDVKNEFFNNSEKKNKNFHNKTQIH